MKGSVSYLGNDLWYAVYIMVHVLAPQGHTHWTVLLQP